MFNESSTNVPSPGQWAVDPQTDVEVSRDRIWIDGCFDFSHYGILIDHFSPAYAASFSGHAGAMLQVRRLGNYLLVGVHSDEEITENKGPTVMSLKERLSAVDACRWSASPSLLRPMLLRFHGYPSTGAIMLFMATISHPIVQVKTAIDVLKLLVDSLSWVGRMLLCTQTHFIHFLDHVLNGEEGSGSSEDYAIGESGLRPGPVVISWISPKPGHVIEEQGEFGFMVNGKVPYPGQRIIYVDGGFDLFSSGHIEFLRGRGERWPLVGMV